VKTLFLRSLLAGVLTVPILNYMGSLASAQTSSTSVHQQIQQTYDFQPHTLTGAQITENRRCLTSSGRRQNQSQRSTFLR
jgi:hypothetical protein